MRPGVVEVGGAIRAGTLIALGGVSAASCGGSSGTTTPVLKDAVWCDVEAVPCLSWAASGDAGQGVDCAVLASAAAPASPPGGLRTCFDSAAQTPEDACAALCRTARPFYPQNPAGCAAAVDTDGTVHAGIDARGVRPGACTGTPARDAYGSQSGAGSNSVEVSGTAMATYGDAGAMVAVRAGRVSLAVPDPSCTAGDPACSAVVNEVELSFEDFDVGALAVRGLTLLSSGSFATFGGQAQAAQPPAQPDATYLFFVPPEIPFDAIGDFAGLGSGTVHGFGMASDQTQNGTVDLANGQVTLGFSVSAVSNGQTFRLVGIAQTTTVLDEPPTVSAIAASVTPTTTCSATVDLSASASSAIGLPVTLAYVVDGALAGSGADLTTTLSVGMHRVIAVATDSLGAQGRFTQALSVTSSATSCP